VTQVDAMRVPDVVTGPAELLHELQRAAPEPLEAEALLVKRLGDMGVQPDSITARQGSRLAHELRRDGARRAWRHRDPAHRARPGLVVARAHLLGLGEDGVSLLDHA